MNQGSEVEVNEESTMGTTNVSKEGVKRKKGQSMFDEQADIPTQKSIFEEENDVMESIGGRSPLKKQWRMKRRPK